MTEPTRTESAETVPVTGILEIRGRTAVLRTFGCLPGPADAHVPLALVRRHALRPGDELTGQLGAPRPGNHDRTTPPRPLVRVDTVAGLAPADAAGRPDFAALVPKYPSRRLRLETEPHRLTTRVVDLVMPIGKGQRALVVAPPKAGKTTVLRDIANGIAANHPECLLMLLLVGERPEEVTDLRGSVKAEVIASTFDRPPAEHTAAAELAIERAKRLAELGRDVVVLLDSITRLGRAYSLAAPPSGRVLTGGLDAGALFNPKRLLGAARDLEGAGSLTIIGTALVETGSVADTILYEEYKSTGNAELKLDRGIAARRVFPAVDIVASGTRREELLCAPRELTVTRTIRRALAGRDQHGGGHTAVDSLLDGLRRTRSNAEFLARVG